MKRQDEQWFAKLLRDNAAYKFVIIIQMSLVLFLMLFIYGLWARGKEVYVYEANSGRTYATARRLSRDYVENMVLFRSRQFIDDFLNYDGFNIERAREKAYLAMSPALRSRYGKDLGSPDAIEKAVRNKTRYALHFETGPSMIARSHPHYRTFVKVMRKVIYPDGRYSEVELNFRLTLQMRQSSLDRPDGLWITELEKIDNKDQATLNEIINKIQ